LRVTLRTLGRGAVVCCPLIAWESAGDRPPFGGLEKALAVAYLTLRGTGAMSAILTEAWPIVADQEFAEPSGA
jgi:hypothetical protein